MERKQKKVSDGFAQKLHDKATRGESLSAEERVQLENWYALQDRAESNVLSSTAAEKTSAALQAHIDAVLTQLTTVTKHIQETAAENEILRREIAALRRQLAYLPIQQPA